jgi:guanylate kinase
MTDKKTMYFNPCCPEPLLIVISGPSGVGKDSVIEAMKERDLPIHFVITATTRPPREGEEHGVDYFFLSREEFETMIARDQFLEHAIVYNDYKGVPKSQVRQALDSGKDVVMRIDVQGAETIRQLVEDALLIFLTVDSEEEMIKRLKHRATESEEDRELRIATAREELKQVGIFDYIVSNREGKLEETVDIIEAIIQAEHHRVEQRKVNL